MPSNKLGMRLRIRRRRRHMMVGRSQIGDRDQYEIDGFSWSVAWLVICFIHPKVYPDLRNGITMSLAPASAVPNVSHWRHNMCRPLLDSFYTTDFSLTIVQQLIFCLAIFLHLNISAMCSSKRPC